MSRNKLPTTRPEFLFKLMGGEFENLSNSTMREALHDNHIISYCTYTVLMDAGISKKDISDVTCDGSSMAVMLKSKGQAKEVKVQCNKEIVRYGSKKYKVRLKTRDRYVISEVEELEDEDDEEPAEDQE